MQSKSSSGASLDLSDATDLAANQLTTAVAAVPQVTGAQTAAMAGRGDTTAIQNVNAKIASITNWTCDAANGSIFGLQVLKDQVEQAAEDETATPGREYQPPTLQRSTMPQPTLPPLTLHCPLRRSRRCCCSSSAF